MHLFGKTTIPGQHISKQDTEEREQNMRAEQTTWPNAEIGSFYKRVFHRRTDKTDFFFKLEDMCNFKWQRQ